MEDNHIKGLAKTITEGLTHQENDVCRWRDHLNEMWQKFRKWQEVSGQELNHEIAKIIMSFFIETFKQQWPMQVIRIQAYPHEGISIDIDSSKFVWDLEKNESIHRFTDDGDIGIPF